MKSMSSVNAATILAGFKALGETLHKEGFTSSYNPEKVFGTQQPERDVYMSIVLLSNRMPEIFFQLEKASFSKGDREWTKREVQFVCDFVAFCQTLPGIRKEQGDKRFRNMKLVWEALSVILDRSAAGIQAKHRNEQPGKVHPVAPTTPVVAASEAANDEVKELKARIRQLEIQHELDQMMIQHYEETLTSVTAKNEKLQNEVYSLRYEAKKEKKVEMPKRRIFVDGTGMLVGMN